MSCNMPITNFCRGQRPLSSQVLVKLGNQPTRSPYVRLYMRMPAIILSVPFCRFRNLDSGNIDPAPDEYVAMNTNEIGTVTKDSACSLFVPIAVCVHLKNIKLSMLAWRLIDVYLHVCMYVSRHCVYACRPISTLGPLESPPSFFSLVYSICSPFLVTLSP